MKKKAKTEVILMKRTLSLVLTLTLFASVAGCSANEASQPVSEASETGPSVENTTAVATHAESAAKSFTINDSQLGEITLETLAGVPVNTLNNEYFTESGEYKSYINGGKNASIAGIDISSFSGEVDWERVKSSGIEFAMIRLGGRGYGDSGELYTDEKAVQYIREAKKAGVKVGAYFFSQAVTAQEAVEEADYAASVLNGQTLDFPLAYDWETIEDDNARTDGLSPQAVTECAKAFCNRAKQLGFIPMIYSESEALYYKYDLSQLVGVDIWYSEYQPIPNFYYEFSMWQYSNEGKVDGIQGDVDLNICFTDIADYSKISTSE